MNTTLDKDRYSETLTLQVKRVIRAKRERVFEAWTRPELLGKWLGCSESRAATATTDVKVGGEYCISMSGGDIDVSCCNAITGLYTEIIANERLCFTWRRSDDRSPGTLVTVQFRDVAQGTEITIQHERFENQEVCAKHERGWLECLDNLEKYFAVSDETGFARADSREGDEPCVQCA